MLGFVIYGGTTNVRGGEIPIGVGPARPGRDHGSVVAGGKLVIGTNKICRLGSMRAKILVELVAEVQVAVHLGTKQ